MEIEPIQGEGLRVSMDYYLRLRRDTDGEDFWGSDCQKYLTDKLYPFLPGMEYDPVDNTVTAKLLQRTRGQEQEEMLHKSKPIGNSLNVPEKAYNELKKKIDELLREIDAEGTDPKMRSTVEAFALPDHQKSPELYRVYGKGKLAILWGLECNPGESIPLRKFCQDGSHSLNQRKKWVPATLAGLVLLVVGIVFWYPGACGGNRGTTLVEQGSGGNGIPGTGRKDSRGPDVPSKPKQVKPRSSGSTVPGPVDPPATSSGGDKKNTGKDGEGTQSPTADPTSAPQTEGGTAEAPGVKESESKTPAVDNVSGTPNVPVPEEGTSPQPGGGDGTATGTEGNSGTTPDGTAEQGVPTEPSNGDKENIGKDGGDTQPPPAVSTSVPQTEEGTEETPGVKESEGKTPAVDTVSGTPNVPVPEEVTSPQPEGGGSAATETEGNSAASTDGTVEQGVRVDPMQKGIQVEFPGRVIDFRFDVLPRKDAAPGNVRVSVQVSVIEGDDNAIESGWIKGEPLDANHRAEVQIKERGEELPYEIKLRNSKYPVTGGCKIKIETTK